MVYMKDLTINNMNLKIYYLLFSVLFFSSCTYISSLNQPIVKLEYKKKFDESDHIPVLNIGDPVPEHYAVLGEIHVRSGDYELNEICSYESAIDKLIIKSFDMGGDAIKIIKIKNPKFGNYNHTCYTIDALSLSYNQ